MRLPAVLVLLPATLAAQGAITGTVREAGKPVEAASIHAERTDKSVAREAVTDSLGRFRIGPLASGLYSVTVRRVGYRSAEVPAVRVADGQSVDLDVVLTQAARQLSTIHVVTSPVDIDASTTELSIRLDRATTELLPSGREASSLVALVPGARKDQLWGGAPGVTNDYQLDGISMNHPGLGGDFLSLSADWIESVDIRGLGAGAEHGNFQGGIVNAITKTGTNERRFAMRTTYEAAGLAGTNLNANELGREQAGRRELSGEALGPVARDRLFYFVAGQYVSRDIRSPDLVSEESRDFQAVRESHLDARGLAKLTWLPALGHRVDALAGFSSGNVDHAGINGIDDASATLRVRQPTTFFELSLTNSTSPRSVFDVRLAGFSSQTSNLGYEGSSVPGVQALRLGTMPTAQNAAFDERVKPSSVSGSVEWRARHNVLRTDHQLVLGTEVSRGRWRDVRTRNGGMTWRPYTFGVTGIDLTDATTWATTGSDWGGEIKLDSDVASEALFAQDYIGLGSRVTLTPGIRYGHWTGYLRPFCEPAGAGSVNQFCSRFDAAHAEGFDPRIGVAWDVTGRNTFVAKAHWGRYHQGMFSLFFDRALGANVYSNSRFYYQAPPLTDSRTTYTTAQRDTAGSGFSTFFDENILDESGRVERYRQPYVDQAVLGLEKSFGSSWKVEAAYTQRRNGDIVGLVDRNAWRNYTPIYDTHVDHRLASGLVLDANNQPLVLPVMYVGNNDLYAVLHSCGDTRTAPCPNPIAGHSSAEELPWDPDLVLTTVPDARRTYHQFTLLVRSEHARWRGEGSLSTSRLRGNVAGVTGYGTTGTRFNAGPFVRRNEALNFYGTLPDAQMLEAKVWTTARVTRVLQGGILYTHILGERFTPSFEINNRYRFTDRRGTELPSDLFRQVQGQSVLVERRGSRHYASRDVVDLRLEWLALPRVGVSMDLFNVLGSDALTLINTNIGDQTPEDPTSVYGAARLRVTPRTLRIGFRVE
ncbi:MAG TPA: carboxypeptidase regulatory-like domain-containing protein [Gemmatimonadaceae bacterium]|nr:carboxypeptidase regulatory-like domain-containing protein [Gemmatimonadaceae bacterium]